jgi:hypothetical protein
MITNIHPADELYDVRARIKALEDREAELKSGAGTIGFRQIAPGST